MMLIKMIRRILNPWMSKMRSCRLFWRNMLLVRVFIQVSEVLIQRLNQPNKLKTILAELFRGMNISKKEVKVSKSSEMF